MTAAPEKPKSCTCGKGDAAPALHFGGDHSRPACPLRQGALSGRATIKLERLMDIIAKSLKSGDGFVDMKNPIDPMIVTALLRREDKKRAPKKGGKIGETKKLLEKLQIPPEKWGDSGLAKRLKDTGKLNVSEDRIYRHLVELKKKLDPV
jgi:hypothetical protein